MTKIFVYATNPALAEQTVQNLNTVGAAHAELLETLNISARQPKENRYLFICETPAEKLSALAPMVLPEADYAQELGKWYEAQSQIVTTATAHKKRSIVVTSSQLADAKSLLTSINEQWGLSLKAEEAAAPSVNSEEPLLAYLVQNLIEQTAPLESLQCQIDALAHTDNESLNETDALIGYRGLVQRQAEQQSQNHQLASTQAELNNQLKDLTEENELLLAQLHTVQEELERIFLESKKFIEDTAKEKADLTAARDIQAKATNEAEEEAKLILNQLHQVQEELEHYFIKFKEAQLQIDRAQTRWQKMLSRHPDYFDYENIQVTQKPNELNTLQWQIQVLEGENLSRASVAFETFIEAGVLGFRFQKGEDQQQSTILQWPDAATTFDFLECIPVGKGDAKILRAKILKQLSASDFRLIQTLPKAIEQALADKQVVLEKEQEFSAALDKFSSLIGHLPPVLRHDSVTLKNIQVNPDYEHLWFVFNNMSYGDRSWPRFEVRIGAANLQLEQFWTLPKIEIPLIDGTTKPFDSWYEESKDDFGPKLEIRMDLSRKLADTEVIAKIGKNDAHLILNISQSIAHAIKHSIIDENKSERPKDDWLKLTQLTGSLLKITLANTY